MTTTKRPIRKLLIANRGEIACRILHTAQAEGIQCIAVYSEADEHALHVKLADEAWCIGKAPAKESYLNQERILDIAKKAQADAIHPGYGFLSENASFAKSVVNAGLVWIGPKDDSIHVMGSKSQSKQLMEQTGVPLVPGYHGNNQSDTTLKDAIKSIGFPALIKASAGGGGKGMRVVNHEREINEALAGAKREGMNSFGDDKLLIEKYITQPRHVEIQIFMDTHGNGVYLFERDCSIQRRHQKVVEEAPAPNLTSEIRQKMGEAALKAAHAIDYVGAGTVEFLYSQGEFYFMEMNTRLQVEHPVTEYITGQDLVSWQLRVAQGGYLPLTQSELSINGHSMEVRVYAEDPDNHFLPTTGTLERIQLPYLDREYVRLDTGVEQGDQINPFYDPMISKLIVWGENRQQCLNRLQTALQQYHICGLTTNLTFLRKLVSIDAFAKGDVSTAFIEQHESALQLDANANQNHICAAVSHYLLTRKSEDDSRQAFDRTSPWHQLDSFRLNQDYAEILFFSLPNQSRFKVEITHLDKQHWQLSFDNAVIAVKAREHKGEFQYSTNGYWRKAHVISKADQLWVIDQNGESLLQHYRLEISHNDEQQGNLRAPMNGTLIDVQTKQGSMVQEGELLLIMEAMKMEHSIKAPYSGLVKTLSFKKGDLVNEGDVLIEIEQLEEAVS